MASDFFLKIEGIPGESNDAKHKEQIDISSFSWGETNQGFQTGGGGGAGKVTFQDLSFTADVSKASPKIAYHCAQGKHITKAEIFARKQGDGQQDYYVITLEDVIVTTYQTHGGANVIPSESFTLMPSKFKWKYSPQKKDGSLETAVEFGWDLKGNAKY
jgi:type VI secretion system secreted protein Hcp